MNEAVSRIELTADERESFFAAIARHRRAAWRVTAASSVAIGVAALITALLLSPLFYAALAVLADLVNLVIPVPNYLGDFMVYVDDWQRGPDTVSPAQWLVWGFWAALPGAIVLGVVVVALHRALRVMTELDAKALALTVPTELTLQEQRLRNVIAEMSIAATLLPPTVLIAETRGQGATVFGTPGAATIVVSRGLLARLNRDELQGIAAHLVATLANGDLVIGHRAALTLAFFNLVSRLAVVFNHPGAGRELMKLLGALIWPTRARIASVASTLGESFTDARTGDKPPGRLSRIQDWLKLILMGPVVLTGFFGGIVGFLLLAPLLAFAWRQRKYMADATAVRLTRDPDTLSRALEKLSATGGDALGAWNAHLGVAQRPRADGMLMGASFVSMFPSLDRRLRALRKLGATLTRPTQTWPLRKTLLAAGFISTGAAAAAVLLPLLMVLSACLSMLFLGLPLSILHVTLRWLGH
jgi:Zn-dependent protease with chaperone function